MKLLSDFRKQINRLGVENIRQAWFTSFNLSPHFAETYILQALAGQSERMSTLADYEALQQKLLDQNIDIRFFSDAAAIDPSEPKRTSFNFHLVNPKVMAPQFSHGVFHPKVIFLRSEDGAAIVGAGSANLTVSGWGRNREVFVFKKVNDAVNRDRILSFFKSLFQAVNAVFPPIEIKVDDGNIQPPDWQFLSSLNNDRLIDRLKDGYGDTLSVWSPYFSEDIVAFKRDFIDGQMGPNVKMVIYPDVLEHDGRSRIRMSDKPEVKKKLQECQDIVFRKMQWDDADARINMTHAKLWQFGNGTAVGSWNCTQAGANVHLNLTDGSMPCNVEAGILLTGILLEDVKASNFSIVDCLMPADQLKDEQEELPGESDRLPFFLEVCFDWELRSYMLTIGDLPGDENWLLTLPGKPEPVRLSSENKTLSADNLTVNALMRKRTYIVRKQGDQTDYSGIIIEKGVRERPVYRFDNFGDLLDAWCAGKPEQKTEMHTPRASRQAEGLEEIAGASVQEESHSPDYFRMFRAFQNMRDKFSEDPDSYETRRLIQTYPGSLFETSEKIQEIIKNNEFSQVFRWFLEKEYQAVLKTAQKQADKHGLQIDWQSLKLPGARVRIRGADRALLMLVTRLAGYERRTA